MTIGQQIPHWVIGGLTETGGEEKTHLNCKIIKN